MSIHVCWVLCSCHLLHNACRPATRAHTCEVWVVRVMRPHIPRHTRTFNFPAIAACRPFFPLEGVPGPIDGNGTSPSAPLSSPTVAVERSGGGQRPLCYLPPEQ